MGVTVAPARPKSGIGGSVHRTLDSHTGVSTEGNQGGRVNRGRDLAFTDGG
jgi:hypothetical protein